MAEGTALTLNTTEGNAYTVGRSSETSNLYSEEDASMDSLDTFSPLYDSESPLSPRLTVIH
jgi:argininosuccinate synthase